MKNICFVIANISNCGGTEKICTLLANNLAQKNFNVSIVSILGKSKPFFPLSKEIHIETLHPGKSTNYISIITRKKLRKYVKCSNFDYIINVDTTHSQITTYAIKNTSTKQITWDHFNYRTNINNPKRRIAVKCAMKNSEYYIAMSKTDELLYKINFNNYSHKIYNIYNGLPKPNQQENSISETKTVLTLGRNSKQKGFDLLLKSWAIVEKEIDDWKLIISGKNCTSKYLLNFANRLKLKNVEFNEADKNIDELYNKAALYISSSRYEGLALTIIEAMQRKIPVIAFESTPSMKEIISDGLHGILVSPQNYKELAFKTIELIRNKKLRHKIANNAFEKSKQFAEQQFVDKWVAILN